MKYVDKNGNEICAGMTIKHDDGDTELVYLTADNDLGINASNEKHKSFNPLTRQLYPLYQMNMKEWEIVL